MGLAYSKKIKIAKTSFAGTLREAVYRHGYRSEDGWGRFVTATAPVIWQTQIKSNGWSCTRGTQTPAFK